jgi:hypothetical protein
MPMGRVQPRAHGFFNIKGGLSIGVAIADAAGKGRDLSDRSTATRKTISGARRRDIPDFGAAQGAVLWLTPP